MKRSVLAEMVGVPVDFLGSLGLHAGPENSPVAREPSSGREGSQCAQPPPRTPMAGD